MKPPPLPLLPLILTLIFLLILAFTPAECKKEKKQHMSEHAKMEPDWYDDEHEEEDFLEDGGNETDWTQQGIRMSESQFSAYWPPRTGEGVRFEETEDGMKEWLKYRDKQMGKYKEYLETLNKTLKNLTEKHNLKDFNLDLDNMARRYPFCVTGDLPIMDLMQFEPSGPLDLNTLTTIDLTLKEKDGLTDKDKVDPDLQEFKTLFLESQARKVVVATPPGISTIEHVRQLLNFKSTSFTQRVFVQIVYSDFKYLD
ncbi:uncharacterized protein LOC118434391 [Folsomia candida]|uniref:uncharacterized protein LOC118434391 n=1 Tax=Folsomia candida TaxID=158441 RepID=UPI001605447A|nr:uncharacterized protein LOC118434391 [Folsomia candida]